MYCFVKPPETMLIKSKIWIPLIACFLIIILNLLYIHAQDPLNELITSWKYKSADQYKLSSLNPKDLRIKLWDLYTYEKSTSPIPRNIWQMWKTDDIESLDRGLQDLIMTWKEETKLKSDTKPPFKHEIIPNPEFNTFVANEFSLTVPEIIAAFIKLPLIILQSDLIRYLTLFAYGGVYSDIDTSLKTPLDNWMPYNNTMSGENKIGLVLGIESDRDDKGWSRRLQFCQWTLQAKAGHPFFRELIYRIVELALNHYDPETQVLTKNGKQYDFNDGSGTKYEGVMEWTGPAMFTDTVFDYLNEVYKTSELLIPGLNFKQEKIVDPNQGLKLQKEFENSTPKNNGFPHDYDPIENPIGWQNLTLLEYPILFDEDVLILPSVYFAGQGEKEQYVVHHFKGSWKD